MQIRVHTSRTSTPTTSAPVSEPNPIEQGNPNAFAGIWAFLKGLFPHSKSKS